MWKLRQLSLVVLLGFALLMFLLVRPAGAQFLEFFNYIRTPTLDRGVRQRIVYDFPKANVKVLMPRFLPHPRVFQTGGSDQLVMLRTPEDTCGLYQLSETIAPFDAGPPPHFHFASSEWFFVTEDSKFRIFGTQTRNALVPGQLPGVNAPVPAMGSTLLTKGGLAYSPKGTVHFWHNETPTKNTIRGFYNVWSPANGVNNWFEGVNSVNGTKHSLNLPGPQATTLQTALWGVPHDPTGSFVGTPDFRSLRGPLAPEGNHLSELQNLFDRGEACYPK